jgi:hypothetical protein
MEEATMAARTRKVTRSRIPLAKLRTDGGTQPRDHLDPEVVEEYRASYEAKRQLPPLVTVFDGKVHWLVDGFHRLAALQALGTKTAEVEVHRGTQVDAIWIAAGANQAHGLRRTREDKQRAISMALESAAKMSPQPSSRQIADHVGVDHKTIEKYRTSGGSGAGNWGIPQLKGGEAPSGPEVRVGQDGKSRPVGRRTEGPGVSEPAEAEDESTASTPVADELGHQITDPTVASAFVTWRPRVEAAVAQLRGLADEFAAFDQEQKAAKPRFREARSYDYARTIVVEELKQLAHNLAAQEPFCVCPYCQGAPRAADPLKRCKGCWGGGWMDKSGWENAPPEKRAEAKAGAKAGKEARHG